MQQENQGVQVENDLYALSISQIPTKTDKYYWKPTVIVL